MRDEYDDMGFRSTAESGSRGSTEAGGGSDDDAGAGSVQNTGGGDASGAGAGRRSLLRRLFGFVRLLLSGEILVEGEVGRFYNFAICTAVMFFVSMAVFFTDLRMEKRCHALEREVELLHERSIRMAERRCQECSHTAIVGRLAAHGIELYDPPAPLEVIE